ncbi:MAG: DNA polymerase III subunit delta' [Pseudomonadota bacterium]
MSGLIPLPWQAAQWQAVTAAQTRGQLHHAWLVSGSEGVGKKSFVRAWTAALLCEKPDGQQQACGLCNSCKMLASGGHPDAHLLSNDGHLGLASEASLQSEDGLSYWTPKSSSMRRDIAVDAARSLIDKFSITSHRGGMRVVVIHPASDMSDATANALLKTIEEPPARTVLMFVTVFPQALKQTIRSRCQQLRFATPAKGEALSWLYGAHPDADALLLAEAGGAPLKASAWLASGEAKRRALWRNTLQQVAERRSDPLQAAADLARDKGEAGQVLRLWQVQMQEQLRDGGVWSARHESFHAMLLDGLRRLEDHNANAQLLFESLLLRWRLLAATPASA